MPERHRCPRSLIALALCCSSMSLIGCVAVPLKRLQPVADPPSTTCGALDRARTLRGEPSGFHYVLVFGGQSSPWVTAAGSSAAFLEYRKRALGSLQAKLPDNLKNHKVILKLSEFLTAASGQAQLNAVIREGSIDSARMSLEQKAIDQHGQAPNITHGEMKDFTSKLFDSLLRPGAASVTGLTPDPSGPSERQKRLLASRAGGDNSFVAYFIAYYKGKFVDRMGQQYGPPSVSTTITDTEIEDAETVLLEFIADALDSTPVFGDTPISDPGSIPAGITFYPGASKTPPTVFTATYASNPDLYVYIPTPPASGPNNLCGITTGNVWVLRDLAMGASDEAGAVGGLIANTAGGISLGLGVVGKISIGDNQTLSGLVKTAASRVALRASLASSYWTLRNVKFNVPEPGSGGS